jgi:hypothetical protein
LTGRAIISEIRKPIEEELLTPGTERGSSLSAKRIVNEEFQAKEKMRSKLTE